jgi:hypothetical protein
MFAQLAALAGSASTSSANVSPATSRTAN